MNEDHDRITYHTFNPHFDEETKNFVYHQSRIAAQDALWMMDKMDEVQDTMNDMRRRCHRLFQHHANMVEALHEDYHARDFSVTVREDPGQWDLKAVREEMATRTRDWEIRVGDTVVIMGGEDLACTKYCIVVGKSKTGKTFVLEDGRGNQFRKYARNVQKVREEYK